MSLSRKPHYTRQRWGLRGCVVWWFLDSFLITSSGFGSLRQSPCLINLWCTHLFIHSFVVHLPSLMLNEIPLHVQWYAEGSVATKTTKITSLFWEVRIEPRSTWESFSTRWLARQHREGHTQDTLETEIHIQGRSSQRSTLEDYDIKVNWIFLNQS